MMAPMAERRATSAGGRRRPSRQRRTAVAAGVVIAASLIACGDDDPSPSAVSVAAPTTTGAPTTSETTTRPTSTTSTVPAPPTLPPLDSTTLATSTTVAGQATEPIPPPVDAYASEPVIEMGTLTIPRIDVAMTMYEGIRIPTLDAGPGHWPGSALPGQPGNVVVAGHRTSTHAVFRDVDQLEPGDEIVFDDERGRHVYRVDRVEIVEPTAVWIVDPTDTPTATLFACHPPGSTRERIVVFADLVTS